MEIPVSCMNAHQMVTSNEGFQSSGDTMIHLVDGGQPPTSSSNRLIKKSWCRKRLCVFFHSPGPTRSRSWVLSLSAREINTKPSMVMLPPFRHQQATWWRFECVRCFPSGRGSHPACGFSLGVLDVSAQTTLWGITEHLFMTFHALFARLRGRPAVLQPGS